MSGPGPLPPGAVPTEEGSAEYRVGKCRPPLATRFRPGQSGNPRGRPKGARSLAAAVAAELGEFVAVKENGREGRITKRVAVAKRLVNRAVGGDPRATQLLFALVGADESRPAPPEPERLDEGDALVMAELVRRIRSSTP